MPGLYNIESDLNKNLDKNRITYGFKNTDRDNKHHVYIGVQDKDILQSDISPIKYGKDIELVKKSPSTWVKCRNIYMLMKFIIEDFLLKLSVLC